MAETSDIELLRQYWQEGAEDSFAELVRRHIHLIYSTALRHVGITAYAEEITQAVFVVLAQKSGLLREGVVLEGWLYHTTRLTALKFLRGERRRQRREQEAYMQSHLRESDDTPLWNQLAPLLDEAVSRLGEKDRRAILLRYFKGKKLDEIAAAMSTTEAAAQSRVHRAVEKMRQFFARRGVTTCSTAIAATISANSIQAAPAGLAAIVTANVFSATTTNTAAIVAATKVLAMTTFQKAILTTALIATVGAGIFEAHQNSDSQRQIQSLRQQQNSLNDQIAQLQRERDDATERLGGLLAENAQLKSNSNQRELLKLRSEAGQLRTANAQLKAANAQNESNDPIDEAAKAVAAKVKQMKQWLEQNPNDKIPEFQYLTDQQWLRGANYTGDLNTDDNLDRALSQLRRDAKRTFANSMGAALDNYIANNNGQLPGDISQLEFYFDPPVDGSILQRYRLLQTGNLSDFPNNEPLIAEKAPVDDQYDSLFTISATGYSYQGTGTPFVNGSGQGGFGANTTAKIKPFERQ